MSRRKFLLVVVLAAAAGLPAAAHAQISPRGIIGAFTRPLGAMLGRFGHFPRRHHGNNAYESQPSGPPSQPQLGSVGPLAWQSAYEDVLGYTFWPGEYAEHIRAHGFDVVAAAIIGARRGREPARVATTGAAVASESNATQACDQTADAQITWPVSQIEQMAQLDGTQREALGRLQTALAESIKTIKAGCRDVSSLPPLDRVTASLQQIWAVRDAGIYVRMPLKAFYDSLTDAQKAGFKWKQPQDNSGQSSKAADSTMARQYQACASPSLESSEQMLNEIQEKVRPNKKQSASMESLRKTTTDMAKLLTASCAQSISADPVARLDSANNQLSSMSYAATSLEIALDGFYAQLDRGQKASFDLLGR